jgi:TldD protein
MDESEKLIEKAGDLGASYAGFLYQRRDSELIEVDNMALKSYSSRSLSGVGVRLACGGALGYASTSDMSREGLENCLEQAVKAARSMAPVKGEPLRPIEVDTVDIGITAKKNPFEVPPEEKVSLALDANKAALNNDSIKRTRTRLGLVIDERIFLSSEGASVRIVTPLVGLGHASVAEVGGVKEMINDSKSLCAGYEFIEGQDWNSFASGVSDLAVEAVASKTAPPGTHPVVVDQVVVGLVLHEALGHATEGDTVATGGSVLGGKLGTRIASDLVTIIDEGVVEGGYYYPYDDEGAKKGRTVLVEDGILKGYLTDRRAARRLDMEPTGNGRAQDFENYPIVRQTNYYMEPGDHSLEELVEGIDLGILVQGKGMRGGQVEIGMGTFTFGVGPSRMIRNGEVQELVRGVVISGSVLDVLKTVDAVGDDFKMRTSVFGSCGKNNQQVKTGGGGPSIRAWGMTVGGR